MTMNQQGNELTGAPAQQQQLEGLKSQRSALTDQLLSQTIRRDLVNQQLRNATGQTAADLQAQIRTIDASVKATTTQLDRIDQAVRQAATSGLTSTTSPVDARLDQLERVAVRVGTIGVVGIVAVFALLLQSARRWWRRPAAQLSSEDSMRLDHLQRAVDVIAVEVERISETQRFMAKRDEDKRIAGRDV
jgi:hypothetical protein